MSIRFSAPHNVMIISATYSTSARVLLLFIAVFWMHLTRVKQVKKPLNFILDKMIGKHLEFRVRLFNILASFGFLVSLLSAIASFMVREHPIQFGLYFLFALISLALIVYSVKTGRYQRCYMITIVLVFLIGFPVFFFQGGGYYGAMPYFFIFAVLFTIFMLESKRAVIMSVLELILYILISVYARDNIPVKPEWLEVGSMFFESVFGFTVVSVALGVCLFLHFRLYNEQQRKLDEQNAVLAQANRAKTEFLQDMSHELKNPLHIIATGIAYTSAQFEKGDVETAREALQTINDETLRLGRMVGGMVALASMSDVGENRKRINFAALINNSAEAFRYAIERQHNTLLVDIAPGLPDVFVESDRFVQVMTNLLTNAANHTQNGTIVVTAEHIAALIAVNVHNSGASIPDDLLPQIFERGMSGDGGTGYGLSLCKTIIEAHGGTIQIVNTSTGVNALFTVPVYGGQEVGHRK